MDNKQFDPKMMQDLMGSLMGKAGGDPIQQFKMFTKLGQPEMLNTLLDQQDMLKFGPDFLAISCMEGSKEGVQGCLQRGVDILSPPESVQHVEDYRKTAYIILAAKSGDTATFQTVLDNGGSLGDCGIIGLTKKRKNQVVSNVIGCAAYHGQNKVLKYAANRLGKDYLDLLAIEQPDKVTAKEGQFKKEMSKYTPLMLACARSDENLECVKSLLQFGANFECLDEFGNNVLHIAAMNGNNKIIDYLSKNLKIGIFARNKNGESALSICETLNNDEGSKILQKYMEEYDTSKSKAQLLLEQLEREEKAGEESKDKKKAKKWRNKVNKISKAEGISVEEVEKRLAAEAEETKNAAENQKKLEAQKEKQAELDEIKRREENRKLREQIKRQEEQEAALERARLQKEEQMAQQEARRAKEAQKEKYRAEARQKREKEQAKKEQSKPEAAQGAPAQKKERVKSNVRPAENNVDSRTPRHQQNAAQQMDRQKSKSKSIRRADSQAGENALTGEVKTDRVVFGLGGELAMQAAHSKKAQQRMKKHMRAEEEEQKKQEELMQQKANEKLEAKKAKEEEERKQIAEERKAQRLSKQKEAQAKKEAAEKSKPKEDKPAPEKNAQAEKPDLKKKKEKPNTPRAEKKEKPEKVEKVYRPKTAATEAPKGEVKIDGIQIEEALFAPPESKPKAAESLKKVKAPKTEEKIAESPKVTSETASKSAKKTEEPKVEKQGADKKQKQDKKYQKKEKSEKSQEEQKTPAVTQEVKPVSVSSKSSVNRPVVSAGSSSEIESLQKLLLAKEKEIGGLKRHIDKQDKKLDEQTKQNQEMKADLETQAKSDTLKKSIADLNDKLRKQTALNRLQASQILEFEQALWQAAKQKEEAEERMYDYIQNNTSGSAPNPAGGDDDLLQSTNQDLRIKSVQIRELQLSVDSYQGKATAINGFSKTQLTDLHEELAGTMFKVKVAMENLVGKK